MSIRTRQDTNILKQRIIKRVYEGDKIMRILAELGVNHPSFYRWLKIDERFKKSYELANAEKHKRIIYGGLETLASGYEEITDRDEWIEENESGEIIKKSRTRKQVAPNIQAIMKLANKYTTGELRDASENNNITIRITQKDRSLTIEERLKVLEGDKSLESKEDVVLDASDYEELEAIGIDPPTKD